MTYWVDWAVKPQHKQTCRIWGRGEVKQTDLIFDNIYISAIWHGNFEIWFGGFRSGLGHSDTGHGLGFSSGPVKYRKATKIPESNRNTGKHI